MLTSPAGLTGLATILLLGSLFMPVVTIKMNSANPLAMLGLVNGRSISGLDYVGSWGFIPVIAFAAATAARVIPAIAQYRKLLDQLAFLLLAAILIWAITGGSIGADLRQAQREMTGLLGSRAGDQFRFLFLPYFGAIPVLAAPLLLIVAKTWERQASKRSSRSVTEAGARLSWLSKWGVSAIAVGLVGIAAAAFFVFGLMVTARFGTGTNWIRALALMGLSALTIVATCAFVQFILTTKLEKEISRRALVSGMIAIGSVIGGLTSAFMMVTDISRGFVHPIYGVIMILVPFLIAALATFAFRRSIKAARP